MNRRLLAAVAAIALALAAGPVRATAYSTDYSDLWWNPAESGWGIQFVQQANVIFATMFVYDAQGNPTWYTATLDPAGGPLWRGDLYVTRGSWFGGSFDAGNTGYRRVGRMNASFATPTSAALAYDVDGVNVAKAIQRQTLRKENFSGTYAGFMRMAASGCTGVPANETLYAGFAAEVSQAPGGLTAELAIIEESMMLYCTYRGDYSQSGRFGRSQGTFQCPGGDAGTFTFSEMTVQQWTVSANFVRRGADGCTLSGTLSGVRE